MRQWLDNFKKEAGDQNFPEHIMIYSLLGDEDTINKLTVFVSWEEILPSP